MLMCIGDASFRFVITCAAFVLHSRVPTHTKFSCLMLRLAMMFATKQLYVFIELVMVLCCLWGVPLSNIDDRLPFQQHLSLFPSLSPSRVVKIIRSTGSRVLKIDIDISTWEYIITTSTPFQYIALQKLIIGKDIFFYMSAESDRMKDSSFILFIRHPCSNFPYTYLLSFF